MRVRYFVVAAACAICLLALPQPPAPVGPQVAAAQIDFDALHAEAKGALEALQHPSQRQASLEIAVEF
jgi:hypothetical protein